MMKITVCLKEAVDPRLNLDFGLTNRVIFREGRPITLDPNDAKSLALALDLKARDSQIEITLVSIGPERVARYLRDGLALGADKAVRIWGGGLEAPSPYHKARLLAGAVATLGADLVFTGDRSLDTGNGQVGPLTAAWLGWPGAGGIVSLELENEPNAVNLVKDIGRGKREKIRCGLPAVIAVKGEAKLPYASLDRLIDSKQAEVKLLTPPDLGISPESLQAGPATVNGVLFPRPAVIKAPRLDSSLPAFDRILQLLQGGISRRKGLMLQGSREELAEQLFKLLKDEGVIKSV